MRPVFAIVLAVAILGSVKGYMSFQKAASARRVSNQPEAVQQHNFELRFATTFAAAADPFQLYPAAVQIRRIGSDEPILRYADEVSPETTQAAEVYLPSGVSQLIVEARAVDGQVDGAAPEATPTLDLQVFSKDSGAAPAATAVVTLRREGQRLVGETEIKLP